MAKTETNTAPKREEYAPYHVLDSFAKGVSDYWLRNYENPYKDGVNAQAWDRGLEYAMRVQRHEFQAATAK